MKLARAIGVLLGGMMTIGATNGETATAPPLPTVAQKITMPRQELLLAQRVDCRKVVAEGVTPFYNSFPRAGSQFGVLQQGDRVSLNADQQPERGPNGQFYLYVSSPYGGSNPNRGYIPTQYQTRNGESRSTLGSCGGRRARW